ncbi:MAG: N-acetyl-gamma-glutamyl-phosphate reductase [bacterium]|nr:N-acetyl-gamma-glutamyl-phosphate reductase [bacterium]
MIKAGIVGATGYTGVELCRLLKRHPYVTVTNLYSKTYKGQKIHEVYPHLNEYDNTLEDFDPESLPDIDVLFLALPHLTTHTFMKSLLKSNIRIIDLSADFRFDDTDLFKKYYGVEHLSPEVFDKVVPGFPEIYRDDIKKSQCCANPGCFSTAAILSLYPLARENIIRRQVIIDAKSGISGAGRVLKMTSHYCEAQGNISAYSTYVHRHVAEIESVLNISAFFSPHLIPVKRGILTSSYIENEEKLTLEDIIDIYKKYYKDEPFIIMNEKIDMPGTKYVSGSNNCLIVIKVFEETGKIVIFSAIDNLIKGAAGQAIQNMNVMFGFEEKSGLDFLPLYI